MTNKFHDKFTDIHIERKKDPKFKESNIYDAFWHFGLDTNGNIVKIYPSKVVLDIKIK